MQFRNGKANLFTAGRIFALGLLSVLWTAAVAAPPYDITVTFDAPTTGGAVASYNFYIDDCAASGPSGSAFASVTSGQSFAGAITADGSYEMCVRTVNATGENPDPGPVATVNINQEPLPGNIENLDITVTCRDGGGAVIPCATSGVNVSVQIN